MMTLALVCQPALTLDRGLRMTDIGRIDLKRAFTQHDAYCRALQSFGYLLLSLPADEDHPDSVFVEDPAIRIGHTLVMARLRRAERQGEEKRIRSVLRHFCGDIAAIRPPGYVEGGDVVITDNTLYIGISGRTNQEGAEQLAAIAWDRERYHAVIIEIPKHMLHLKGSVTYHARPQGALLTVSEELASHFSGSPHPLIVLPAEERFGANCISHQDRILMHADRPKPATFSNATDLP